MKTFEQRDKIWEMRLDKAINPADPFTEMANVEIKERRKIPFLSASRVSGLQKYANLKFSTRNIHAISWPFYITAFYLSFFTTNQT